MKEVIFVGLDAHAKTLCIALAEARGEARRYGTIPNTLGDLDRALQRIRQTHEEAELRICYEAGPTGFVIARHLAKQGVACVVVAPSLIPTQAGNRVKTDSRDALKLARLHRAGELTAVRVPDASDEAMRDVCRARTDAVQDLRRGRAQLKAFLLRHGHRYPGKSAWTEAHRRYLRSLSLPHAAQRAVLEESLQAIRVAEERVRRLEEQMEALLEEWEMKPVVKALMGLRGFRLVGAMVIVSELGNAWRFAHPRQLMAFLGLVPTEHSSGERRRQGAISKTGNSHARWLLIEAAHHYRLKPNIGADLSRRQEGLSQAIKDCAWEAQNRLHKRAAQLRARGKHQGKVVVALARELAGFVWAIFRLMEPQMKQARNQETTAP